MDQTRAVNLGDRVKDRISGVQGIAVARTEWLYGCVRITIQPEKAGDDGKVPENLTYDEPQFEVVEAGALKGRDVPTHGGRDDRAALRRD